MFEKENHELKLYSLFMGFFSSEPTWKHYLFWLITDLHVLHLYVPWAIISIEEKKWTG